MKATEGRDHTDTQFQRNRAEAQRVGIPWGAYHYFTFCTPGLEQARHFIEVVPRAAASLPPVVDVEYVGNCSEPPDVETIRAELRSFVDAVGAHFLDMPLIYVTRRSYRKVISGHFAEHELWVRNVVWSPTLRHGSDWRFWQYTDRGRITGIEGPVDLNVFNGSKSEFSRWR